MDEQQPTFTRPYRSKRSRPCDICRGRKVYCRIEDTPPCQPCRKLGVACTFLNSPAKRQQTNYQGGEQSSSSTNQHNQHAQFHMQVPNANSNTSNGPDLDESNERQVQASSLPRAIPDSSPIVRDDSLQQLLESGFDHQQPLDRDLIGSDNSINFDMMDFGNGSYNELQDLLLDATSPGENDPSLLSQNQITENIATRRKHAMVSETGVPPLDFPVDGKDDVHGLYAGLSGETDPYLLRHYRYDDNGEFRMFKLVFRQTANDLYNDIPKYLPPDDLALDPSLGQLKETKTQNPIPVHFMMAADELADDAKEETTVRLHIPPEAARKELDQLIKPEDGSRLVGLFFNYVFPALPVASRFQFGITSSSPLPSSATLTKIPTHLLAAIYALSLAFCAYDDHLCVSNAYKEPPASQLWRIVFEEIMREIHSPRLSVLQACLLYLQKSRSSQNKAAADTPFRWSFMASTVALATTLGLHNDCQDWCIPRWERRLRKRLWWIVYTEEKWRSLLQGQPALISKDHWDVNELNDEDFVIEEAQVNIINSPGTNPGKTDGANALHFRWLAQLALISYDVYQSFYTLRACRTMSQDFPLSLNTAQPLRHRLRGWYASLPDSLRMGYQPGLETTTVLHSNASLHLAYLTLEILLYRALLRPLGRPNGLSNGHGSSILDGHLQGTGNQPGGSSGAAENNFEALFGEMQVAAEATISAAEHCARLATAFTAELSSRDFSGFWYSWSRIGFATMSNFVLLLLIQAPTQQHATESKTIADAWRQTLRFQSKSCDQMKMGMLRLDAIYWSGMEKVFIVEPHVRKVL